MIGFAISFALFWAYTKLIYHKSVVDKHHLIAAHFTFTVLNTMLWGLPIPNLPYWVVVPMLLNSTRIELWYDSIMVHVNNLGYAQLITLKNAIAIIPLFHCADKVNYNSGVIMSVIVMDIMHWVMHTAQQTKWFQGTTGLPSSWLAIRTVSNEIVRERPESQTSH
jgi:hypothetical protein